MKLIFDFDDVLFDTSKLKGALFAVLAQHGVVNAEEMYVKERRNGSPFSLKLFLERACKEENIQAVNIDVLYEEIMSRCHEWCNAEMLELVKKYGKENCYVVTSGNEEFQKDKLRHSGIEGYVKEVYVVPGSKKEIIERLSEQFAGENVIFVDDKLEFFNDIDMEKCLNLRTVFFNENGLAKIQAEIEASIVEELKTRELRLHGPKMR